MDTALEELGLHAAKADIENFADIPEAVIKAGGSAHGARPKFWVAVHKGGKKIILGDHTDIPTDFCSCLVKFAPARGDKNEPFYEAVCLQLAGKHGVKTATARLLRHPNSCTPSNSLGIRARQACRAGWTGRCQTRQTVWTGSGEQHAARTACALRGLFSSLCQ